VLSRASRLTSPADFRTALRRGRRAGTRSLVVHLATSVDDPGPGASPGPARVGFVVSRAVGGATTRNLVKRRLRHLCRAELDRLPAGALLVVRALPAAAQASYDELAADLQHALDRVSPVPAVGALTAGVAR
jgi:ribonuclease P protein component